MGFENEKATVRTHTHTHLMGSPVCHAARAVCRCSLPSASWLPAASPAPLQRTEDTNDYHIITVTESQIGVYIYRRKVDGDGLELHHNSISLFPMLNTHTHTHTHSCCLPLPLSPLISKHNSPSL